MDLLQTPDQEAIVASVSGFLAKRMPLAAVRERRGDSAAFDREDWKRCAELGWFGLGVAEDFGGVGYTPAEEALLFREIGRILAPGPFLPTVLGAHIAAAAGHAGLCQDIIAGDTVVGLGQPRRDRPADIGAEVSGPLDLVDAADTDLVAVIGAGGAALLKTSDLGMSEPEPAIDPGARLASAHPDGVPALAHTDPAPVFVRGLVLAAALQTGIAEATRDMAVEHAKTRVQFGRPIGVNQAIKHRCADMAIRAEAAYSQVLFAALALGSGRSDAEFQALSAKIVADNAAVTNAAENIQVHGGMGYAYEHDSHLYVKRARTVERLLRGPQELLDALTGLAPAHTG